MKLININIDLLDSENIGKSGKVRLFGYNISPDESYNTFNNSNVEYVGVNDMAIKRQSCHSPFIIKGINYMIDFTITTFGPSIEYQQFFKPFSFVKRILAPDPIISKLYPNHYFNPKSRNRMPKEVIIKPLNIVVDANMAIEFELITSVRLELLVDNMENENKPKSA